MARRWHSQEFKVAALEELAKTPGQSVIELSRQLGVHNSQIYRWLRQFEKDGRPGLGRRAEQVLPAPGAAGPHPRIAELQQKIGEQTMDIDFLKRAFERVKESVWNNSGSGGTASTKK